MSVCSGRIPALLTPALLSISGEAGTGPLGCRVVVIPPRKTGTDGSPDEELAATGIGGGVVVGGVTGTGVMNGAGVVVVVGCSGCGCGCCCSG